MRVRSASLPEGVRFGKVLPGDIPIYFADRPAPGVLLLKRWTIGYGPTRHNRIPHAESSGEGTWENPYAGRMGWTLHAMGTRAESAAGMTGTDAASRARFWLRQVPVEHRVALYPVGFLPVGDPLRAPGTVWRQWVDDTCIRTFIESAARGGPKVPPLLIAVPESQQLFVHELGRRVKVRPIEDLEKIFAQKYECRLRLPQGITLEKAARALGFDNLRKPISMDPGDLYEAWRSRVFQLPEDKRPLLNLAYHRVLLHRFLSQKRLTPSLRGSRRMRALSDAIERRANLIQAYRIFVFDRRGCPVAINRNLAEQNNLQIRSLINRKIPHAGFTRSDQKRTREFGTWLFSKVLGKAVTECRIDSIDGLSELLAAVDQLR